MTGLLSSILGITKGHVASVNDGSNFPKVGEHIKEGFAKVSPSVWKDLTRRAHENEDTLMKQHHIATHKEIAENPIIIELSSEIDLEIDSDEDLPTDDDDEQYEGDELTYDDMVGDEDITGELFDELQSF